MRIEQWFRENNSKMNPYYDPEWSVLPPENNRRYVYKCCEQNKCKQKLKITHIDLCAPEFFFFFWWIWMFSRFFFHSVSFDTQQVQSALCLCVYSTGFWIKYGLFWVTCACAFEWTESKKNFKLIGFNLKSFYEKTEDFEMKTQFYMNILVLSFILLQIGLKYHTFNEKHLK